MIQLYDKSSILAHFAVQVPASRIALPDTGQHARGILVDLCHEGNLRPLLVVVVLVDTYGIDPVVTSSVVAAVPCRLPEGVFAIRSDIHPAAVDEYRRGFACTPPRIGNGVVRWCFSEGPGRQFAVHWDLSGLVKIKDGDQPDVAVGIRKGFVDEHGNIVSGLYCRHFGVSPYEQKPGEEVSFTLGLPSF